MCIVIAEAKAKDEDQAKKVRVLNPRNRIGSLFSQDEDEETIAIAVDSEGELVLP